MKHREAMSPGPHAVGRRPEPACRRGVTPQLATACKLQIRGRSEGGARWRWGVSAGHKGPNATDLEAKPCVRERKTSR